MPDGKVKFTYFGDGADLEKTLIKLEKRHDALENKIKQVSKTSRTSSKFSIAGLASQAKAALGAVAAYAAIRTAINAATEAQRRLNDSINETIPRLDEMQLKLQIQAGLTPKQVEGKIPQIKESLLQTPSTDMAGAFQIETQLISSGFKQEDIDSGAALQTVLDLKAATNLFGEEMGNVKESVGALAQFMKATGTETSAANIRKIGGNLTQLFEGSDIQFADLTPLAGDAAALTSKGLSTDIQLAAFSALRDVKVAPEAATGFRQVVSRLSSARESPNKVRKLADIGIKPEDIDLIGETLPTALKRLKDAIDAAGTEKGLSAQYAMFGEKGESPGNVLLGKIDVIEQRLSILQGGAFERNVGIFRNSRYANRQRVNIRNEFAERDITQQRQGFTYRDLRDIQAARFAEDMAQTTTVGGRIGATTQSMIDSIFNYAGESTGQDPLQVYAGATGAKNIINSVLSSASFGYMGSQQPSFGGVLDPAFRNHGNGNVGEKLDENNKLMREQNDLLRAQNNRPRPVNRNAQGE